MKTKILISTICACSLFVAQAQVWKWGYVETLTNELLRQIWTQGLDTVYIVGENGLIARSIDASENWDKQYFSTKVALNDIMFIDHYTGFAVGEQGTVLKTADAGETWKQVTLDATSHINAIAAIGLDNIWAVGNNSLILHSTDAGETWEQMNILPENNRQLSDIAFRGNLGYFTGNYATVYKTENFGATWNKQTISKQESYYEDIHSINIMENKAYLMLNHNLYSTENQANWTLVLSEGSYVGEYPFFLNDNVGYGTYPDLYTGATRGVLFIKKTTDGGKNWERIVPTNYEYIEYNSSQGLFDYPSKIKMINETLGYAIFSQVLVKIPVQTLVGIKKVKSNEQLCVFQTIKNELVLQSESNPIQAIEIFDTLGKKLIHKQWQNPVRETNININDLSKGVYFIKVTHEDSTISINKYLIR